MKVSFAGKTHPTDSLEHASLMFCTARDSSARLNGRRISGGTVYENGELIARISPNGRVWGPAPWTPDLKPICEAQVPSELTA